MGARISSGATAFFQKGASRTIAPALGRLRGFAAGAGLAGLEEAFGAFGAAVFDGAGGFDGAADFDGAAVFGGGAAVGASLGASGAMGSWAGVVRGSVGFGAEAGTTAAEAAGDSLAPGAGVGMSSASDSSAAGAVGCETAGIVVAVSWEPAFSLPGLIRRTTAITAAAPSPSPR